MGLSPHIRFCSATDGTNLAMALYGDGPLLVRAATWLTHIERDLHSPHQSQWIESLARSHTLVTYDMRGCGLSSRKVQNVGFDAWVSDLEAVVDSLGVERFPLFGISQGAPIAIEYAARHPHRVSHLVLYGGFALSYGAGSDVPEDVRKEGEALIKLTEVGWGRASPAFRRVWVAKFFPNAATELQDAFDEYCRLSTDQEMAVRCMEVMHTLDIRERARGVTCPTLVMHSKGDQLVPFSQGRLLASLIPNARLLPIESPNHTPLPGEGCWPTIISSIEDFLGSANAAAVTLTGRQLQILQRVAAGQSDKEIAREIGLSPRTVEMHVRGCLKALKCNSRTEATRIARELGLLG